MKHKSRLNWPKIANKTLLFMVIMKHAYSIESAKH